MSELHLTFNGQLYSFAPGATVRIGRSSENDVIVNDPTVSRRHAQLSWQGNGWTWQNSGQSPTFLNGQPVASFGVSALVEVTLASPQGPVVCLQPAGPAGADPAAQLGQDPGVQQPPTFAGAPGDAAEQGFPGQAAPQGHGQAAPPGFGGQAAPPGFGGQTPEHGVGGWQAPGHAFPGYGAPATPPGMPGFPGFTADGGPGQPAAAQLEMGSFFQTLIPVTSWIHDRGWRQGIRLLIIPYALLPLIFLGLFSMSGNLTTPGWAYSLYIAPLWLLAFWYLIRPPHIGRVEIQVAAGVIIWTIVWLTLVTVNVNDSLGLPLNFLKAIAVGYNEETTKAIPVLVAAMLLLKARKVKLDPRTWMLMGTVTGLTFGIVEQSIYTKAAIIGIHGTNSASIAVGDTLLFAFRVFVDGFQHAVWAGVAGFFIGIAVNYRRRRIPMLLLGVSIPAILHGLNDWSLSTFSTVWIAVLFQAVSLLLFLGYTLSAATIERKVRQNPSFRGQSMLMERFSQPDQAV